MEWQRIWSGPSAALDYIQAFMHRAIATETRYRTTQHLDFIDEIDLSTVYNCQTLISSLKLINSHKQQISCKNLQMDSHSLQTNSSPAVGGGGASDLQVQLKLKPLKVG